MPRNQIMLFFPVYTEDIVCDGNWSYSTLPTDEEIGMRIQKLMEFIDFFRDEECEMVYDSKNVSEYLYPLRELRDCYPSRLQAYRFALKGLPDYRKNSVGSSDKVYRFNHQDIQDDIRCELAARWQMDSRPNYILALHADNYTKKSFMMEWEEYCLSVDCFPAVVRPVFDWLCKNRLPKRVYNWNPKHGENGKGAHPSHGGDSVSVLFCSKEHAAEIMQQAIGEKGYDSLYVYDSTVGKYMEYKAEKKSTAMTEEDMVRKYHSYHIDNSGGIAQRVIKKMNLLNQK